MPDREEWGGKSTDQSLFTGIQFAIWAEADNERNNNGYDPSITDIMKLFVKILNEDFPEYLTLEPGQPFFKFDTTASYDDVERMLDIAMRYANNWVFS